MKEVQMRVKGKRPAAGYWRKLPECDPLVMVLYDLGAKAVAFKIGTQ